MNDPATGGAPHFTLAEFLRSQVATRRGIDNRPGIAASNNLPALMRFMERVRRALGNNPIQITSGYRSPALNAAVGGAANSAHILGCAADFVCPDYGSPYQICRDLQQLVGFDQLIMEGDWVHISIPDAGRAPRHQVLIARFANGGVTYAGWSA
jgi:zinc D-Ala-D-Ala carboxypeptidase